MMNKQLDIGRIKKELLSFAKNSVIEFLKEHSDLVFYAFAFDCNSEYAEVNLCLNTQDSFEESLYSHQTGKYGKYYQTEEEIYKLKYNTGDWEFQCFETTGVLSSDEMIEIPVTLDDGSEISLYELPEGLTTEALMNLFCEVLMDFTVTDEFKSIPKTDGFKILCVDHDESLEESEARLNRVRSEIK